MSMHGAELRQVLFDSLKVRVASAGLSLGGCLVLRAAAAEPRVARSIKQDVLLMAGSEDHYVPLNQLQQQTEILKNARSITTRLFTWSESAQNHCQVGNYGLALKTIVDWLDGLLLANATVNSVAGNVAVRNDEIRQAAVPLMEPTIFREPCHD